MIFILSREEEENEEQDEEQDEEKEEEGGGGAQEWSANNGDENFTALTMTLVLAPKERSRDGRQQQPPKKYDIL